MLVLFDNGAPRGLAAMLTGHTIEEARARGWEELANGELILAAETAGFEVLLTADKNIRYQQFDGPQNRARGAAALSMADGQTGRDVDRGSS